MALAVVVALAVGTAAQAFLGEEFLVELALFTEDHLGFEFVDLLFQVRLDRVFELVGPDGVGCLHIKVPVVVLIRYFGEFKTDKEKSPLCRVFFLVIQ